jgi:hypothetical protein
LFVLHIRRYCRRMLRFILILALLHVAACDAPQFGGDRPPQKEGYPELAPLDEVLGIAGPDQIPPETTASLQSRAAGLQTRAAEISQEQTDAEKLARLKAAAAARADTSTSE